MHILINKNYLIYNKYKVKCAIGKRGIGNKKKEGDLITPKGQFKIKFILYRKDRVKLKTKLKKVAIQKNMIWCDDPKSKKYNQIVRLPFKFRHEKLYKKDNTYDIVLVLNFNMNPTKRIRGVQFLFMSQKNYKKTEGCVAIRKFEFLKIIREITVNTKVKIFDQK